MHSSSSLRGPLSFACRTHRTVLGCVWAAVALVLILTSCQALAQTLNWDTDVGSVPAAGSSSYAPGSGTYQLTGTGTGLGGSADAFHFAYYEAVRGDGQIIVRLANSDTAAQAALILRGGLGADAASAAVTATNGAAGCVLRLATGGGSVTGSATASVSRPCWLKLTRNGSTVSAFASPDGQTWNTLGSDTLALGTSTIYVGLAVSNGSASNATGASASFDRMASTFLPAEGLLVWLKADSGVTADATTQAVSAWADQSGNGNDAVQATAGSQPLRVAGVVNSLPALRFDGSDDQLRLPSSLAADNFTIYVVAKPAATHKVDAESTSGASGVSGERYLFGAYPGAATQPQLWTQGAGAGVSMGTNGVSVYEHTYNYLPALAVLPADLSSGFTLLGVEYQNRQPSFYVNGGLSHTGLASPQPQVHAPLEIGSGWYGAFQGDVAEVLFYDHALTANERASVGAYLNARYAIVSVPSAPTSLTGNSISASQVNLLWQTGASTNGGAESFLVERKPATGGGDFAQIASVTGGPTGAFIDESLVPGASYTYRICAHNPAGVSAYSAEVSVSLPPVSGSSNALPAMPDLSLWLKADAGVFKDASGFVSAWTDVSGHGNDALQADTASQPQWMDDILNGRPVLHFDGSADRLATSSAVNKTNNNATILVVVRLPDASICGPFLKNGLYAGFGLGVGGGSTLNFAGNDAVGFYDGVRWLQPGAQWGVGTVLAELSLDSGGNPVMYRNGTLLNSLGGGAPNPSSGPTFIGGYNYDRPLYFRGDIAEVLMFNRLLTDTERQSWENYLNAKYLFIPPPPAPTQVEVVALSATQVAVSWTDAFQNISGYRVERQDAAGNWSVIATLGANAHSFIDTGLLAGSQYSYRVIALNGTGSSPASVASSTTTGGSGGALPITNLRLWLKADAGVSSGNVGLWLDQSGLNNHAHQESVGLQPTLLNNALNGRPALHFDGNNYLALPPATMLGATQGEMFIVVRSTVAAGGTSGLTYFGNQVNGESYYPHGNGHIYDSFGSTTTWDTGPAAVDLHDFHLYDLESTAAEWTSRLDGLTRFTTTASGSTNTVGFNASPYIGTSHANLQGDIAEILVFDHALSAEERESLGRYINSRYAFLAPSVPATPSLDVARVISGTQIGLNWNDGQPALGSAIVYSVERAVGTSGVFGVVAEVSNATSYVDGSAEAGTTYTYRVRARNAAGFSDYSATVAATSMAENRALPVNGLRLWLKADAGVSGSNVGLWLDQSGLHNDGHQEGVGQQPAFLPGAINGRPALHFDGNFYLALPPTTMQGATAGEMFLVIRSTAAPGVINGLAYFGAEPNGQAYYPHGNGHIYDSFGSTALWDTGPAAVDLSAFHLYNAQSTTAGWTNRIDGITRFTSTASATANTVSFNGAPNIGSSHQGLQGDIAEVLVFDHALTDAEREAVGRYLGGRYALAAAPAAPANVTGTAVSANQISLLWNPAAGQGNITYTIERKVAGSTGNFIAVAEVANATSFLDTGLVSGVNYLYRIRARSYAGQSDYSVEINAGAPALGEGAQAMSVDGLRLWLKADAGVSGSSVGLWLDQSGRHNDAHQEGVGQQPAFVAGAINGRPALHFDGNSYLALPPTTMQGATAGEMFLVIRSTAAPGVVNGLAYFGTEGNGQAYYPHGNGNLYDSFGCNVLRNTGPAAVDLKQFHLYDAQSTSAEWTNRIDGVTRFTTTASGATNTVGFNGAPNIGSSNRGFQGDIAEVLIFDHPLSGDEREALERYVNGKYGCLASAAPAAPSLNTPRSLSSTQVSLSWNDGQPADLSATIYILERKAAGGAFATVVELTDTTSYIDATLEANTAYTYRLRARNASGASNYSAEAAVATPASGLEMPTDGLRVWLKADSGVSGSSVGLWLDQSGLHNDAHQEDGGAQPALVADARNGRAAVRFDGNDALALRPGAMAGATSGEMFLVTRSRAPVGASNGMVYFGSQINGEAYYPHSDGHVYDSFGTTSDWNTGVPTADLTKFHLYDAQSTSAEWTNRIDGAVNFSTLNTGTTNTVGFTNLANLGGTHAGFQGDIAEILVFDHALSLGDRDRLQWYLVAKYLILDYDLDGDGLTNRQEITLGTDPFKLDTNGDGISDGISIQLDINPLATGGFNYTTPPSPTGGGSTPPIDPNDHTPPVITLTAPADAVPLP